MLGTNSDFSYPLSSSLQENPGPMQFTDPIETWCDLDGLSGMGSATGTTSPMMMATGTTSPMKVRSLDIGSGLFLISTGSQ